MQMFEDEGLIIFELTRPETDTIFHEFAPFELSQKDWQDGYRFMRLSFTEWFERMIGPQGDKWGHKTLDRELLTREIWFLEKSHAMAFKLTFSLMS